MGEKGEKSSHFQSEKVKTVEELRKTVERDPKNIKAWIDLGKQYTTEGEKKKAYDTFKEGLEHNPESWEIWEEWGNFFMHNRNFCRAYTCFYNALELLKSKKEEIPLNYHFNLVKALSNLPKGDPGINIEKAILYLKDVDEKTTDLQKKVEIKYIEGSLLLQLASSSSNPKYNLYKEASLCFEEVAKNIENIKNPGKKIEVWWKKGLLSLVLQEGGPKDWLRNSEESFDNVLKILKEEGRENSEMGAEALFYKGLIKKDLSDFNPFTDPDYGDKEKRIKDLEESADSLIRSYNILKKLIEQNLASPDNIFSIVEKSLGKVTEELKNLKGETPPHYQKREELTKEEVPYLRYIY